MNDARKSEEDPMNSTSTFFIEIASVTGISPLGMDSAARLPRSRRMSIRRQAPAAADANERFVEELLATFSDRWEW
jgi:hypothetical protein